MGTGISFNTIKDIVVANDGLSKDILTANLVKVFAEELIKERARVTQELLSSGYIKPEHLVEVYKIAKELK